MTIEELTTAVEELRAGTVPLGTVVAYAGILPQEDNGQRIQVFQDWFLCNGAALDSVNFRRLYDTIRTSHGDGSDDANPATDFNLPDFRGLFLRGVSGVSDRDPDKAGRIENHRGGNTGNQVGSFQLDQIQTHRHRDFGHTHPYKDAREGGQQFCDGGGDFQAMKSPTDTDRATTGSSADIREPETTPNQEAVRVSRFQTHPKNAYVYYIIRAR